MPEPLQLPLFGKEFEAEADVGHKRRKPWGVSAHQEKSMRVSVDEHGAKQGCV